MSSNEDNVVQLDDFRPHSTCQMTCPCGKVWQAVFMTVCTRLECPACGQMVSVYPEDENG